MSTAAPLPGDIRYAVIRFGGTPPDTWQTLCTPMFDTPADAWEFAGKLDYALVYELVPQPWPDR
jgi:hypothetical protein